MAKKPKLSKEDKKALKESLKASVKPFVPDGHKVIKTEYEKPTMTLGCALMSPKNASAWYSMVKQNYDRLVASGDYKPDSRYLASTLEMLEQAEQIFKKK